MKYKCWEVAAAILFFDGNDVNYERLAGLVSEMEICQLSGHSIHRTLNTRMNERRSWFTNIKGSGLYSLSTEFNISESEPVTKIAALLLETHQQKYREITEKLFTPKPDPTSHPVFRKQTKDWYREELTRLNKRFVELSDAMETFDVTFVASLA